MAACAFAYPCRMEIGTFEYHICSCLVCAATFSSENTGYAHRFIGVADGKVLVAEFVLLAVEGDKRSAFRHCLYHYLFACHHIRVETMQRLSVRHHDVVCDIYNVVNRTKTYHAQFLLQPFRALLYLAPGKAHAGIAFARVVAHNFHVDGQFVVVCFERPAVRAVKARFVPVAFEPRIKVARHSPVGQCVGAVSRDINFYQPVAFKIVIFGSRSADFCIFGQYYYAVVACPHSYFVFCAYHSETFYTAQF